MTTFDFSPLFRSTIGFDRLARLMDEAFEQQGVPNYPPCNIEAVGENEYRIALAVAGFSEDEVFIETVEDSLTVSGHKKATGKSANYLYQGIAARDFVRKFQLADHVKVVSAGLHNGLLWIDLAREIPEAMKPRRITIKSDAPEGLVGKAKKLIEDTTRKVA
ncbi:MAG: Hsp20 family protein [Alphaproteobacteria bacterium]|nr:Hsp20 family protein [Alphaproteobacteria bacterium]